MKKIAFYASSLALAMAPALVSAQETNNQNAPASTSWGMGMQDAPSNTYQGSPTSGNPEPDDTPVNGNGSGYQNGNGNGNGNGFDDNDAFGNWQNAQPFSGSVFAQANRGGISANGFMAEQGESGSSTHGSTFSDIGATFDTCAGCEGNKVFGSVTANQEDQGYAFGISTTPGTATVAESVGSSATRVDFGAGFNGNCVGPCGGSQPSSNGGNSDH